MLKLAIVIGILYIIKNEFFPTLTVSLLLKKIEGLFKTTPSA